MRSSSLAVLFAGALSFVSAAPSHAAPRVHFGGVGVSAAWSRGAFPFGAPYYFFDPFLFGYFHPGYFTGFAASPETGEVRLHSPVRDAQVYLDGGYAGELSKLKRIHLAPGVYDLELRTAAGSKYDRRIYVLSGKILRIHPEGL